MNITGSIIQAHIICPRKAWLMSRQICGDQLNENLSIGRLYSEESFKREKKEIMIDGNKIDFIKSENGELTLVETKKSSKMIKASRMQLLNYLYAFYKKGYSVKGEIRIPKEKKIIQIPFTDEERFEIEKVRADIEKLIELDAAPSPKMIGSCKKCSYYEFCWS